MKQLTFPQRSLLRQIINAGPKGLVIVGMRREYMANRLSEEGLLESMGMETVKTGFTTANWRRVRFREASRMMVCTCGRLVREGNNCPRCKRQC